jgi:hypothetical protein
MNASPGELLVVLTPSINATRIRVPLGIVTFGSTFNSASDDWAVQLTAKAIKVTASNR